MCSELSLKDQSDCAVEGQVGVERKTNYWTTDLTRARMQVRIVQTEKMGWVPGTLEIRITGLQ